MKPQRSRSRNNKNRNRGGGNNQGGNVVNRVFDSSGPEGKVRGTPSQVIEKYNQLARDAQLSNDRVAMENFQQHAEHYLRLLSEAQKEADAKREEQERQNRERQAERDEQDRLNRERQAERDRERNERQDREAAQPEVQPDPANEPQPVAVEEGESTLVETPETKPKTRRAPRRKPKPKEPAAEGASETPKDSDGGQPEAAE
ncbi:DUF4167 domain-containing protein [uncultured Sulfitobacter sp.]|uniref:DUF4167 domain-containing protein n=1 Tax=uncultured Sulfitobacter sp. TaxID=191468 RepID=UPI002613E3CE|nr:DUF4167 domain-containing protein [uncultured Sulfitobacter sp.]